MKKISKNWLVIGVIFTVSCDAPVADLSDASTIITEKETCTLYVNPALAEDAGDGTEAAPFSSIDIALEKAMRLKSRCAGEVSVVFDDSLSDAQFRIAEQSLSSSGITLSRRPVSGEDDDPVYDYEDKVPSANAESATWNSGVSHELPYFPKMSDQTMAVRAEQSNSVDVVGSSNDSNPWMRLNIKDSDYVDWVFENNRGNLNIKRSSYGGSAGGTINILEKDGGAITMVKNGGTVGVGTSPATDMAITVKGMKMNSNASDGTLQVTDSSGAKMVMDANEINGNGGLYLNHRSKQFVMMCGSGCNVGVGKFNASTLKGYSEKLIVDGGIRAEELVIDKVTGADFVFEDDYPLMGLDEVFVFVRKNRHLPGIASAKEMQTNGLEMGEFQIKLLQKIEELTLYIVDQNEKLKSQGARIEAVVNENDRLRTELSQSQRGE